MRFVVVAAGFDGTLARDGRCDPRSIVALRALAASGRKLVLVTSRELRDLLDVFPDARIFDYLVAENGAVVHRPAARESAILAQAPPETLIHELRRRQVAPLGVGSAVLTTAKEHREIVVDAIRKLRLDCHVLQNDRALAVLPTGVNKASGVSAVLEELQLSPHNLVAIGDAENDLDLFALAEHCVAVGNAAPALKDVADRIARASYGEGFVEFARELLETDLDGAPVRRKIVLGVHAAHPVTLLPGRGSVLIGGPQASGKTELCNSIVSQYLAQGYQCCIFGAYRTGTQERTEPYVTLGDAEVCPRAVDVLAALEKPQQSVVINVAAVPTGTRASFIERLLFELAGVQKTCGRPHVIVFDQADSLVANVNVRVLQRLHASMRIYLTSQPWNLHRDVLGMMQVIVALGDAAMTLNCFRALDADAPVLTDHLPLEPRQGLLWLRDSGMPPLRMQLDQRETSSRMIAQDADASATTMRPRSSRIENDEATIP